MGALVVMGALIGAFVALIGAYEVWRKVRTPRVYQSDPRVVWNAYAADVWRNDGFYPHEGPDGKVRWCRAPRYDV